MAARKKGTHHAIHVPPAISKFMIESSALISFVRT